MAPKPELAAVILTLNEAARLKACIAAIPHDIPVLVLDSGSTDGTVELASDLGLRVARRPWTGFADQRNHALIGCGLMSDWVLFIDADELYGAEFYDWARTFIRSEPQADAVQVPSRLFMDGRPLRFAPGYPVLHPRLVRREAVRFTPNHAGHGEALEPCRTVRAPLGYDHYFQEGDLLPWLHKHLRLAEMEADARGRPGQTARGRLAAIAPKGASRALARFAYHYLLRGGFLDGRAGFRYALMYAWYELTIHLIRVSR